MGDVVQEDAADGVGLEDLLTGGELGDLEKIVLFLVHQRDKGIEAPGLILQITQPQHMIDPVGTGLDVPEKHRSIALATALMPFAVNLQPAFGGDFAFAEVFAHFFIENLRPAAGHTVHPAFDHPIEHLIIAQSAAAVQIVHLCGRHGLDVYIRQCFAHRPEGIHIPLNPPFGIVGRDDVNFLGSFVPGLTGDGHHLIGAHGVGFGVFTAGGIGTEFAGIGADIGGVDVTVDIEIALFAVFGLANGVGQLTQYHQVQIVESFPFGLVEALAAAYFFDQIHVLFHCIKFRYYTSIIAKGYKVNGLKDQIETLLHENAPDFQIAKVLKDDLKAYNQTLENTFAQSGGKDFLVKHTRKIDQILGWVYRIAVREMFGDFQPPSNTLPLALVALGSYGREQMSVYSDIDLMIVYRDIPGFCHQDLIEKMLYLLWDTGLKLGHRVHEVGELLEISRTDITIKTALLESRFIIGSRFVWTQTQSQITRIRHDEPDGFIRAKIEELRRLHQKYGLTMEPNLKEGVGGFRDANLVFWIGKLLYDVPRIHDLPAHIVDEEDYRPFRIALEFLFRVRSALHLAAGKKEDRLRLEFLPEVARLLGYPATTRGHTRLARRVSRSLKHIRLYSKIWLEALVGDRVPDLYEGLLLPEKRYRNFRTLLEDLNRHAERFYTAHPRLLQRILHTPRPERPDAALYPVIRAIFDRPHSYAVLTTLSSVDWLGYTIAPLKKVINLPQFDGYHHYTVDLHSLQALRCLESPIDEPLLQEIYDQLRPDQRRLLKIVTLLHDAGKGRKRDHHFVGASLFRIFAEKLGLSPDEIATGERLITYHTLMSTTAQREDLYSEKTLLRFASRFDSKPLLDMIYLLTFADMKGVGGKTWSPFVSRLVRTLYRESLAVLENKSALDETARRLKKIESLQRSKAFTALPEAIRRKILAIPSNAFFIRHTTRRIIAIGQAAFKTRDLNIVISNGRYLTLEIIRRDTIRLGYLLARLSRLNVVGMEITKLFDDLKYFKIDFGEALPEEEIPFLEASIQEAYSGTQTVEFIHPKLERNDIVIDCDHTREYATLRLRTRDQKGLLAYLIYRFDAHGIDVASTKIHTIKGRVNDLFLIEKNGNFCHNIENLIIELTE